MAAKVVWYRNAWWVRVCIRKHKTEKKFGDDQAARRKAEVYASQLNRELQSGQLFQAQEEEIPCGKALEDWYEAYKVTLARSTALTAKGHIRNHLIPFFGGKDLRNLRREDLLLFAQDRLARGLHPKTIRENLSTLRRVLNLLKQEGKLERNVAARLGEITRAISSNRSDGVRKIETWTRDEAISLLAWVEEWADNSPQWRWFFIFMNLLFATGLRRGEAIALQWGDVDFESSVIHVRRSITTRRLRPPKSGRARLVPMPRNIRALLLELERQTQKSPPDKAYIFHTRSGRAWGERSVNLHWSKVMGEAKKDGLKTLSMHCARHTYATLALKSGKSIRWVAEKLGHSDPAITLRTYAHVLKEEDDDCSFVPN